MKWNFTENGSLAYQIQGSKVFITDQVCQDNDGYHVMVDLEDDFYVSCFSISPKGDISCEDWLDLRQFNNSGNLEQQLLLLNELVAKITKTKKMELNLKKVLKEQPIFSIKNVNKNQDSVYDLEAVLVFKDTSYNLNKQYIKYTFIENSICNRTWTISDLYNFYVHLQVFLYNEEKKKGYNMFLQVDKKVEDLLKAQ